MKWFSLFFFLVFFTACNVPGSSDTAEIESTNYKVKLSIAPDCNTDTISSTSDVIAEVSSLNIKVFNDSKEIYNKSLNKSQLQDSVRVDGIPDATDAYVIVTAIDNNGKMHWQGRASNLTFKKGKTTTIELTLYPLAGISCLNTDIIKPRFGHRATQIPDGRIIISGGFILCSEDEADTYCATNSVVALDIETGNIEELENMSEARAFHSSVLLNDGSILFTGGVKKFITTPLSVTGFPELPFTLTTSSNGVEKYTVGTIKQNQKTNNIGKETTNKTEFLNNNIYVFYPYQSYVFDGNNTLYLAGGIDSENNNTPVSIIYSINTETGELINQYEHEASIMPLLEHIKDSDGNGTDKVIMIGGKPNSAESYVQTLSTTATDNWGKTNLPNPFFGSSVSLNNTVYTVGGAEISGNNFVYSSGNLTEINLSTKAVKNGSIYFSGSVFNKSIINKNKKVITITGGSYDPSNNFEGSDIIQHLHYEESLDFNNTDYSNTASPRIFPEMLTALDTTLNDEQIIESVFVIGGISSLGNNAEFIEEIEVFKLQ